MEMPTDDRFIDVTGKTFGFLEVIEYAGKKSDRHYWLCKCTFENCGNKKVIGRANLGRSTLTCGCLNNKRRVERSTTHHMSHTKIYQIWKSMRKRCRNPQDKAYSRYGGRGIRVCEGWDNSFDEFYSDMGDKPNGKTLDRLDNDGNYCKENCEWRTYKQQANNTRRNHKFLLNGKELTTEQLAEEFQVTDQSILSKIHYGSTKEKIVEDFLNKRSKMKTLNLGQFDNIPNQIKFKKSTFPGGECYLIVKDSVPKEVRILARINSSEEIMQLMMATDALRRKGAKRIHCVIPYLSYSRQDRKCNEGESHSLKVFSNIINSLHFDSVTTWDVHSIVAEALFNNFINISNEDFIDFVLRDIGPKPLNIVFPDLGASKKIDALKSVFEDREINILICGKDRDPRTTEIIGTYVPPIHNDWDFLIVDDITDGGATFLALAKEIQNRRTGLPIGRLYLATTHGIYSKGFEVFEPHFSKLYCTNSIRDIENPLVKQFPLF